MLFVGVVMDSDAAKKNPEEAKNSFLECGPLNL